MVVWGATGARAQRSNACSHYRGKRCRLQIVTETTAMVWRYRLDGLVAEASAGTRPELFPPQLGAATTAASLFPVRPEAAERVQRRRGPCIAVRDIDKNFFLDRRVSYGQ